MKNIHNQVTEEYKILDAHLNKIDQDQNLLESKLEILEKQVKDITKVDNVDKHGKQDIINKCVSLNKQVSNIEGELDTMIEEFNHDTEDGGEVMPENLSVNTQSILNNYFEIL
jgi:ABC-type phosphate transport system auxiliary subunit